MGSGLSQAPPFMHWAAHRQVATLSSMPHCPHCRSAPRRVDAHGRHVGNPSTVPALFTKRNSIYLFCQMTVTLFSLDNPRAFQRRCLVTNTWTCVRCNQLMEKCHTQQTVCTNEKEMVGKGNKTWRKQRHTPHAAGKKKNK